MGSEQQKLVMPLTILSAAILLFVVLFPYTPTPIATTMGKILAGVVLVFAGIPTLSTSVISSKVSDSSNDCSRLSLSYQLLDLICVRLC